MFRYQIKPALLESSGQFLSNCIVLVLRLRQSDCLMYVITRSDSSAGSKTDSILPFPAILQKGLIGHTIQDFQPQSAQYGLSPSQVCAVETRGKVAPLLATAPSLLEMIRQIHSGSHSLYYLYPESSNSFSWRILH